MLSFHVKFVQTDRRTTVKQYAPDLLIQGHKNFKIDINGISDQLEMCKNIVSA